MSDLPAPLTPPDCDLRGLEWMPLYGDRLFASDTWLMASPEGRGAAMQLWWAAWKQCPAGSVPDHDRALCQLAGYGAGLAAWQAIREEALHGWIRCADGRLYHPVVCALALEAWERRRYERDRKRGWRNNSNSAPLSPGQDGDRTGTGRGQDGDVPGMSRPCPRPVPDDSTGQNRDKESPPLYIPPPPSAVASPAAPAPPNKRDSSRGTRLPADWQPSEADVAYARQHGVDPVRVAEDFRGYWLARAGAGARKADWSLTWQGWCRREAERHPQRSPPRREGRGDWIARELGVGATLDLDGTAIEIVENAA